MLTVSLTHHAKQIKKNGGDYMPKIFIDAGHGGKDSGAVNGNIFEKDIALKIALKLNETLKSRGFQTQLSRSADVFIELNERARKANNFGSDILVSVHLNSAANAQASGIETLVYSYNGQNKKLGDDIQNALIAATNAKNRGVKERPELVVLNSTKMLAVLVECGFLCNVNEKNLLVTDAYQNKIADAITDGISKYYSLEVASVVNSVDEALKILQNKGVINSPEYWFKAVDVVKHLDELFINVAKKIG